MRRLGEVQLQPDGKEPPYLVQLQPDGKEPPYLVQPVKIISKTEYKLLDTRYNYIRVKK